MVYRSHRGPYFNSSVHHTDLEYIHMWNEETKINDLVVEDASIVTAHLINPSNMEDNEEFKISLTFISDTW